MKNVICKSSNVFENKPDAVFTMVNLSCCFCHLINNTALVNISS